MKTKIKNSVICSAAIIALLAFGCEKKTDEEKKVSDIVKKSTEEIEVLKDLTEIKIVDTELESMDAGQLRSRVMELKEEILSKQADLSKLTAQVKKIPATEMLGDKAKKLKADIENMNQVIKTLTDQYKLYHNMLKVKNGDLSGLEL